MENGVPGNTNYCLSSDTLAPNNNTICKLAGLLLNTSAVALIHFPNSVPVVGAAFGMDNTAALTADPGLFLAAFGAGRPFSVNDLSEDKIHCNSLLATGPLGVRFFTSLPFKPSDGSDTGIFCLMDRHPRTFTAKEDEAFSCLNELLMHDYAWQHFGRKMLDRNGKLVHDLRNPLTVISLQSELVKTEESVSPHVIEMCQQIVQAAGKAEAILRAYMLE